MGGRFAVKVMVSCFWCGNMFWLSQLREEGSGGCVWQFWDDEVRNGMATGLWW